MEIEILWKEDGKNWTIHSIAYSETELLADKIVESLKAEGYQAKKGRKEKW